MANDNKAVSSQFTFSVNGLGYCCGAAEVGSFIARQETGSYYSKNLKRIDWSDLQPPFYAAIKARFDELISTHSPRDSMDDDDDDFDEDDETYGVLIATTTPKQGNVHQQIASDILEKTGWSLVSKNVNPNTGNEIFTWLYNRNIDKKD